VGLAPTLSAHSPVPRPPNTPGGKEVAIVPAQGAIPEGHPRGAICHDSQQLSFIEPFLWFCSTPATARAEPHDNPR
jgi:hypothetical protein